MTRYDLFEPLSQGLGKNRATSCGELSCHVHYLHVGQHSVSRTIRHLHARPAYSGMRPYTTALQTLKRRRRRPEYQCAAPLGGKMLSNFSRMVAWCAVLLV